MNVAGAGAGWGLRGRDRDSYTLSVKFGMLAAPGNAPSGTTAVPRR